MKAKSRLSIILLFFLFSILVMSVAAKNLVEIDYYYSGSCGSCEQYSNNVIKPIEEETNYSGKIIVNWKDVSKNSTYYDEWQDHGFKSYACVVINNETKIPKGNLTYETLVNIVNAYIEEFEVNQSFDETIIEIPFIGKINTSTFSIPVLTVVLGVVDSFNVCSMFILFVLLSLLVNAQSRKRMLLVGGIFIFFSFLWYLLFMFILKTILGAFEYTIISMVIGIIAILIGIINFKDFFFFKKGISIGIPEKKKSGIYQQIRKLVKTPYISVAFFGTILLAVTVNLFELVCSFIYPALYIDRLTSSGLSLINQNLFIIIYNIIYVIPLIVIFMIFVFTLGRWKLSEWQAQKLKLFSGIMIFSFGILLLTDYMLLENVITPVLLLIFSIVSTVTISYIWKKYKKLPEEKQPTED